MNIFLSFFVESLPLHFTSLSNNFLIQQLVQLINYLSSHPSMSSSSRYGQLILGDSESIEGNKRRTNTRIHEVFISFRGKDTRASFTSHLYSSLQNAGISVFRDDDSLQRGDHISTSLIRAIEESQISVIIFSTNYAESLWCLEELNKIMSCHRTKGQVVLPVFYGVDPSEVRHQTGEFGKAFENRWDNPNRVVLDKATEDMRLKKIVKLRKIFLQASSFAGFVVLNSR